MAHTTGTDNPRLVIKLGGSTLATQEGMLRDVIALAGEGALPVVVHGGGAAVSAWMERLGLQPSFRDGLRVTDGPALEVVRMVLGGMINQDLVALAATLGARAVGLTGLDGGGLLRAGLAEGGTLGYVGEVTDVDTGVLLELLKGGYLPIVAPLGLANDGGGPAPTLYNINADMAAGAIGAALPARAVIFLTDVEGVRGRDGTILTRTSRGEIEAMIADGTIHGGMIPKVQACLTALRGAESAVILDGRQPHSLRDWASGQGGGTVIEV